MKISFLKTLILASAVCTMTGLTACNNKPDDAKEAAEDRNDKVMDDNKSEKDAQFLVDAADINLMEIDMARMAMASATMPDVKDFAKKMEADHQKAYDEVAALATSKNVTIPGSVSDEGMKHHKDLADKTGYDFDRAFMNDMIDGHEKAINKFEKASDDCQDAEIKDMAGKMLPTLNAHLAEAKVIKEKVKDMK